MDLIRRLRRWALSRPHVLIVDAPGETNLRWAAEPELERRGWPLASSPTDADLLLVLGDPGPELSAAIDVMWQQVPQPRLPLHLVDVARLGPELDTATDVLVEAAENPEPPVAQVMPETDDVGMDHSGHGGMDHGGGQEAMDHSGHGGKDHGGGQEAMDHGGGHEGMDHSEHAGMDHSGHAGIDHEGGREGMAHGGGHEAMDQGGGHEAMDHSGHGGMDHGGHHMHHGGSVAGLAMADTGPDRDGLQLDILTVALGPVLVGWPTGLLVQAKLQGDVIVDAEASWVDGLVSAVAEREQDPRRVALDHLARFLLLAGWPTAARDARRARDGLGTADPAAVAAAQRVAARLARRVARSRTLAWSVRDLGVVAASSTGSGQGDVLDRVRRWCAIAAGEAGADDLPPALPVEELPVLLNGVELAAARLIVASLAVERDPVPARHEALHG